MRKIILVEDDGSQIEFVPKVAVPDPPPVKPAPLSNQSRVRGNIDTQDTNSSWHLYIDAAKSGWPAAPVKDKDGKVLYWEHPAIFVDQPAADGVYTLWTLNDPHVEAVTSGATRVERVDLGICKVNVPAGQKSLTLRYSSDPGAVELCRPGYTRSQAHNQIFTNEALAQLAPFGGIRFMDLTGTNSSTQTTWATRPKLTDATWGKAAPWEVCIALCNQTGKDGWFNIPHKADADYITNLGKLIDETLRPDVAAFVEFSNETWNGASGFGQRGDLLNKTREAVKAGDLTLTKPDENAANPNGLKPDGTARNETYALYRYIAKCEVEARKLLPKRIRMIMAGQNTADMSVLRIKLEYVAANYGPPKDYFDAIATAPYFGLSDADQRRTDLTPDQVSELLVAGANPKPEARAAAVALGQKYELPVDAYECTLHLHQGASPEAIKQAQSLPRTGEAVELNMRNNFASGYRNCYAFVVGSNWGWKPPKKDAKPGTLPSVAVWGASPGTHATGPKWDALARVAGEFKN